MKKNQNSLIVLAISMISIMSIYTSKTARGASLSQIMSTYCVPASGGNCDPKVKATFIGTANTNYTSISENYCECPEDNMRYDKAARVCSLCPAYTFAASRTSTECWDLYCADTGDYPSLLSGNDCPNGYEKILYSDYMKKYPRK